MQQWREASGTGGSSKQPSGSWSGGTGCRGAGCATQPGVPWVTSKEKRSGGGQQ